MEIYRYIISANVFKCKIEFKNEKKYLPHLLIKYTEENYFEIFEDDLMVTINENYNIKFDNEDNFNIFYDELNESFYNVFYKDKK